MSEVVRELPRYKSIKQLWALKISNIVPTPRGHLLGFTDQGYAPHEVPDEWMNQHKPEIGGYFVVYEDGYQSFSPAEAFEAGNVPLSGAPTLEQLNRMIDAVVAAAYRYAIEQDDEAYRKLVFGAQENLKHLRRI